MHGRGPRPRSAFFLNEPTDLPAFALSALAPFGLLADRIVYICMWHGPRPLGTPWAGGARQHRGPGPGSVGCVQHPLILNTTSTCTRMPQLAWRRTEIYSILYTVSRKRNGHLGIPNLNANLAYTAEQLYDKHASRTLHAVLRVGTNGSDYSRNGISLRSLSVASLSLSLCLPCGAALVL